MSRRFERSILYNYEILEEYMCVFLETACVVSRKIRLIRAIGISRYPAVTRHTHRSDMIPALDWCNTLALVDSQHYTGTNGRWSSFYWSESGNPRKRVRRLSAIQALTHSDNSAKEAFPPLHNSVIKTIAQLMVDFFWFPWIFSRLVNLFLNSARCVSGRKFFKL